MYMYGLFMYSHDPNSSGDMFIFLGKKIGNTTWLQDTTIINFGNFSGFYLVTKDFLLSNNTFIQDNTFINFPKMFHSPQLLGRHYY